MLLQMIVRFHSASQQWLRHPATPLSVSAPYGNAMSVTPMKSSVSSSCNTRSAPLQGCCPHAAMKAILVFKALQVAKHYIAGCLYNIDVAPEYNREFKRLHILLQIMAHDMPIVVGQWVETVLLRSPFPYTFRPVPEQSMYYDALIKHYRMHPAHLTYAVLFEYESCPYSALRVVIAWRVTIVVKHQHAGRWKSRAVWKPCWFFWPSERRLLTH